MSQSNPVEIRTNARASTLRWLADAVDAWAP